jgi:hypothetical protein
MTTTSEQRVGTYTVLDMLLFVAACSVSALMIRQLRPASPSIEDYLLLSCYCGPAGLSLFGPWAVRRQFLDSAREELEPGEVLWIALGGAWLAGAPLQIAAGRGSVAVFSGFVAVASFVPALVAYVQSLARPSRRPWTHWVGITLCFLHTAPAWLAIGPVLWDGFNAMFQTLYVY